MTTPCRASRFSSRYFKARYWRLALVVSVLAVTLTTATHDGAAYAQGGSLPYDPLTPAEQELARATLLADARLRAALSPTQRYVVVSVERHEEPKDAATTGPRRADVVIYNYDTNTTIVAVVALGAPAGADDITVATQRQPALAREEVIVARQLALRDVRVQAVLQSLGLMESELIISHMEGEAVADDPDCATHRCVRLFFNTRNSALGIEPIVDLTAGAVRFPAQPLTGPGPASPPER